MSEERMLFGSWLQGQNLDDMQQFEETDFHMNDLFRLLKSGKTALQISRETSYKMTDLAKMMQEYSFLFYRQIVEAWQKEKILRQIASIGSEKDVEKIQERIDFLLTTRSTVKADSDLSERFMKEMEEREKAKPVKYGLPTLDEMTGGLKRKELTAVAARPSVGKSAFALQIASHVQESGQKVLFFPLEMSALQTIERLCVMKQVADPKSIKTGRFQNNSIVLAQDYIYELEKSGLFKIFEGIGDIEKIRAAIRQENPFLVVVDQLTQMKANKPFKSKREQFSYMTNELKAMAMHEDVAIMLLCQLNRGAEADEPTMANLKESGSIEEDSDNVIMLHRVQRDQLRIPDMWAEWETPVNINLAKQRSGETGSFLSGFNASRFRFYEKAKTY